MTHSPKGQGTATAIKRKAVPALLHKKSAGTSNNWRRDHTVTPEDINIYVVLKESKTDFKEEGEDKEQEATLYNVEQSLPLGSAIEFLDKGWLFVISHSTQRPAINPAYYKARGVMHS